MDIAAHSPRSSQPKRNMPSSVSPKGDGVQEGTQTKGSKSVSLSLSFFFILLFLRQRLALLMLRELGNSDCYEHRV